MFLENVTVLYLFDFLFFYISDQVIFQCVLDSPFGDPLPILIES